MTGPPAADWVITTDTCHLPSLPFEMCFALGEYLANLHHSLGGVTKRLHHHVQRWPVRMAVLVQQAVKPSPLTPS